MNVFDASAIIALLKHEPGADVVAAALEDGEPLISAVNLSEVVTALVESGVKEADVLAAWRQLSMTTVALDEPTALAAARLRKSTRRLGLSLGDRCCLALAQKHNANVVTADRAWAGVTGFKIVLIR